MKNQECKGREEVINVNTNPVKVNKCSGNCNNINDLYARICVLDVVKNINLKAFNLMSWSNQKNK